MRRHANALLPDEGEAYARKLMQVGVSLPAARVLASFHRLRHVECFCRYARSKVAIPKSTPTLPSEPWGDEKLEAGPCNALTGAIHTHGIPQGRAVARCDRASHRLRDRATGRCSKCQDQSQGR
jgi:hypothetical protein